MLGLIVLGGCAKRPLASDPQAVADDQQTNDPLEPTNRVFYAINDGLDTVILRPLAVGYTYVPQVVRTHVHDFLDNLGSPVAMADDMMQGKPRRAGDYLMRGLINTTIGVGGIFDVATDWGYPGHTTDAGITLALWGVDEGPFLFLPVLGPGSPRDSAGMATDIALDPFTWFGHGYLLSDFGYARYGMSAVDIRSRHVGDIDKLKATALDPYATFRSLYRQRRQSQIDDARADDRATIPVWFPDRAGPNQAAATTP